MDGEDDGLLDRVVAGAVTGQGAAGGVLAERAGAAERVVDHGQAGSVVEDRLDLDHGDHVRHAGQHVVGGEHGAARLDGLGEAPAVAGGLADGVGDERGRLGDVEPHASGAAGAGQLGCREDQQPVPLGGGQSHGSSLAVARRG